MKKSTVACRIMGIAKALTARSYWEMRRSEIQRKLESPMQFRIEPEYHMEAWYGRSRQNGMWGYLLYTARSEFPIRYEVFDGMRECLAALEKEVAQRKRIVKDHGWPH